MKFFTRDIRGDVHMHTFASDGKNSIREMADAATARGYEYIAITDHSKNLAMTNGSMSSGPSSIFAPSAR